MSHNNQKKIALINDFTGFGKCSIAVSLPIISTLKIHCCPVPTSIFSNHTAYPEYFFDDYTDKMQDYIDKWKYLNLEFEGISTGFLGSARQIEIVTQFIEDFKRENTKVIVDPVMGDFGVKYQTYTKDMCDRMKELVSLADIITPNLTESCILTDVEYDEKMSFKDIRLLADKLYKMGPKKIVITGIIRGEYIYNYIFEEGKKDSFIKSKRVGCERSGTGDVFSAIISADAVNGVEFTESVRKAVKFIKECLIISQDRDIPCEDGICFEDVLTKLK